MLEKETLFWFCALSGSGLFLVQFVLYFIGVDADHGEEGSLHQFKWLSKQAITGFLMMFGWVGLACRKELACSPLISAVAGVFAGAFVMFATGFIFKMARKLRSTGTVFSLHEAIGKDASVYQRIPKGGVGKVSISLYEMTHEVDAISLDGEEIGSFTQVQVVKKADEKTLVVTPIK